MKYLSIMFVSLTLCLAGCHKDNTEVVQQDDTYSLSSFKSDSFEGSDGSLMKVGVHTPKDLSDKCPLIIYLHDTPHSDNDDYMIKCMLSYMQSEQENAHILVPSTDNAWTGSINRVIYELVDSYKDERSVDKRRVYAIGVGQGANGLLQLVLGHPDLLSSVILISGGPERNHQCSIPEIPEGIVGLNIWAITSYDDKTINRDYMKNLMLAFFVRNSMYSHYTELFEGGHQISPLYSQLGMWDWLFNSRRVE